MKVAILFFGLTRTLEQTIESIKTYLLHSLDKHSIEYDIFIHTYKIFGPYTNMWSRESVAVYHNEDVETLLRPKYVLYDNQETIVNSINVNDYYNKLGNWTGMSSEMTKYLIRNMCLALYSKKQITTLFEAHKDEYEYAILIRPDMKLTRAFDVSIFNELNHTNIVVPQKDWYMGCNDRMCVGKPNVIAYCGKLFDDLQAYSNRKSIVSEIYFLDKLKEKGITILPKHIEYDNLRIQGAVSQ